MPAEVELQRRDESGNLVPWTVNDDGTEPVADAEARATLTEIVTQLADILTTLINGQVVTLDTVTLDALEQIVTTLAPGSRVIADAGNGTFTIQGTVTVANQISTAAMATEATLASLRDFMAGEATSANQETLINLVDQVELLLTQIRDQDASALIRLTEMRDTLYRRTDPLPAGTNIIGLVGGSQIVDLEYGRIFAAGERVTTSLAAPNASLTVTNPTGSGKALYVISWSVYADALAAIRYYRDATSTGTLLVPENLNQQLNYGTTGTAPAVPSVAQVRVGASVLTGGRLMSIGHQVNGQAPLEKDIVVKLMPGQSLSIRFIGPGATNAVEMNAAWIEKAI